MIIKEVHLKNIGPHRECKVTLSAGTVVVTGHNGAGKSTFVNSIYAALTNDFDRFNVVKAKIISSDSGDEPSFIRISGEHRGKEFSITRSLRPNSSKLVIGDGKPETSATRINAVIESELGISRQIIDTYIFVAQWSMFQFLDHTPAKRAEAFQHLCGTSGANAIYDQCQKFIAANAVGMVADNSLELTAQATEIETDIARYTAEVANYSASILTEQQRTEFTRIIDNWQKAVSGRPSLAAIRTRMVTTMESIEKLKARREELAETVTGYEDKMQRAPAAKKDADAVKARRQAFLTWDTQKRNREAMLDKANRVTVPPEPDTTGVPTEQEDAQAAALVQKLTFQLNDVQGFLSSVADMAEGETIVCPECQQAVTADYISRRRATAAELQEALKAPQAVVAARANYMQKKKDYDKAVDARKLGINFATSQLALCVKEAVQDVTEQEILKADRILQNITKLQADLQTARNETNNVATQLVTQQQLLRNDANEQQRLTDIVETNCPLQDEYDGALLAVQAHNAVYEEWTTAKVTLEVRKASLVTARKAMADLEAAMARQNRQHDVLSTLHRAAQVFHWNELPKKVAQANLRSIVCDVNENLMLFDSPFTVEADDSLTFIVHFPGKAPVEATQLSGGQKVVLAVAFRAALGRVFGNDVGMMFMDEPTAGLDADNVGYFHEALQRFASRMAVQSQLVVVTHVDALGHAADQRIEFRR